MKGSMKRRVIAGLLAFALVLSTAFSTTATTTSAASNKAVKTVTLKIGKKNVTKKTYTMKKGATATVKVTVKPSSAKKAIAYKTNSKKIATVSKKGKITAKGKGTAKITVTVTGKNKKKKSTYLKVKVTEPAATTAAPVVTTAAPAATTAAPAATTQAPPVKTEKKVTKIDAIDSKTGEIVLTFDGKVAASELASTTISVTGEDGTKITAAFKEVSADGNSAVYVISADDLTKLQTGEYTIASDTITIPADKGTTSATVQITGSSVKGLVYYKAASNKIVPITKASVTIGGKTCKSNDDGYYEMSATAATHPLISVKADGYFDASKKDIKVVNNKASAYNFSMEPYNISKVYLYGTVTNKEDSTKVIKGASVTLYENGEVKARVSTDENGRFVFKNSGATISNFDVVAASTKTFYYGEYIDQHKTYTIKVEKNLADSNLDDVYKPIETGVINLGSAKNVNVDVSMTKVKNIGEITMKLNWVEGAKTKTDSSKISVTFMDTDGCTVLKKGNVNLAEYLNDAKKAMSKEYKLANDDYFGTGSNNHPTLPAGTYYIVVKDLDAESNQQNATTVIPVAITEGGTCETSADVQAKVSRTINYTVGISDEYKNVTYKNQKKAGNLKKVTDAEGTLGNEINVTTNIYQKVGSTLVLINTITGMPLATEGASGSDDPTYTAAKVADNLAANTEYSVETIKSNLVSEKVDATTENTLAWNVAFNGAANVVKVKVKEAACFRDEYAENKTAVDETVLVNSVTIKPASGSSITAQVNKKVSLASLCSEGVTIDDPVFYGLKPGEYTVNLDIEGYKLSSSSTDQDDAEKVIDLEDATVICSAKYDKVYPTTVKGQIAYASTADNAAVLAAEGVAVLYTKDKTKIVAATKWTSTDRLITYSLEDGKNGNFGAGDYVLVIRGKGIDTQTKDITITAPNTVLNNQDFTKLAVGGNSKIKAPITTTTNSDLDTTSARVTAYDEYYIDPWDDAVDVLAFFNLYDSKYTGAYSLRLDENSTTTWVSDSISAGKYNVEIVSDITVPETKSISVSGDYTTAMKVALQTYDDLIKIKLYLTNKNDTYSDGQVDYIVASSTDGTVTNKGVFIRASQNDDFGYFYVPKDKLYNIYVYSNDTLVATHSVPAQSSENEEIYVTCQEIK